MNKTEIIYAFWYESKGVLFDPQMKRAIEFQHLTPCEYEWGETWAVLYHDADSHHYWEWECREGEVLPERVRPKPDANPEFLCGNADEHGNVCPYLDQPCMIGGSIIDEPQPPWYEAKDVMEAWVAKHNRDKRLTYMEVIERA